MSELVMSSYRLTRLLERGDFVESYLGEHVRTGAVAVLKIFQGRVTGEEAFQREAQRLAGLSHPHLVPLLDFDIHEGVPFLILEAFPDSVRQLYPAGAQLPLAVVMDYVRQVSSALQYAHKQGIVHGDVRPEQMLLSSQDRRLLLSDLGIVTIASTLTTETTNRQTSPYRAPEQARGELQPASDQYALARVVYEWLSGERAGRGVLPSLQAMAPGLPIMVEPVLRMALVDDPGQRFKSIQAFVTALEQAGQGGAAQPLQPLQPVRPVAPPVQGNGVGVPAAGVPISNVPPPVAFQHSAGPAPLQPVQPPFQGPTPPFASPPPLQAGVQPGYGQARKGISRRALLVGGVAGAVGVAALGIGGSLAFLKLSGKGATAPLPPTLVYTYTAQSNLTPDIVNPNAKLFLWSPDSQRIATIGSLIKDKVHVWNAVDGSHESTWAPNGASDVVWKGNSLLGAWLDDKNEVHILDVVSAKELLSFSIPAQTGGGGIIWSPDGKRLASIGGEVTDTSAGGVVSIWDATTGAIIASFTAPADGSGYFTNNEPQSHLIWSPDSTSLLSWGYNGIFYVLNAQTGRVVASYRKHWEEHAHETDHDQIFVRVAQWSPDSRYLVTRAIGESTKDNTLHVWSASDGKEICIYQGHTGNADPEAAWSPDSRVIASLGSDQLIHVWDASTAARLFVHPVESESCLAWKPGSRRIASTNGNDNDNGNISFHVWDATSGANDLIYGTPPTTGTATPEIDTSNGNYLGARVVEWSPDGQLIAALDGEAVYIWKGGW